MSTIQATVRRIEGSNRKDFDRLTVRVRRGYRDEICYYPIDAHCVYVGSRIEVERRVNNPYLTFVRVVSLKPKG